MHIWMDILATATVSQNPLYIKLLFIILVSHYLYSGIICHHNSLFVLISFILYYEGLLIFNIFFKLVLLIADAVFACICFQSKIFFCLLGLMCVMLMFKKISVAPKGHIFYPVMIYFCGSDMAGDRCLGLWISNCTHILLRYALTWLTEHGWIRTIV